MRRLLALLLALSPVLAGCARIWPGARDDQPLHGENPPGSWRVVKEGETLLGIALEAGVPLQDLMEINGIDDADKIAEGQLIYVLLPAVSAPAAERPAAKNEVASRVTPRRPGPAGEAPGRDAGSSRLRWPLESPQISSPFGERWGRPHEGIDLVAPVGTPVRAAAVGQVLYAGDQIAGYGNMVVLAHAGGLVTVYAHNSVLLVQRGDTVSSGQQIARVGQSGRASAPHLHFEVREGEVPRDPVAYLPGRR